MAFADEGQGDRQALLLPAGAPHPPFRTRPLHRLHDRPIVCAATRNRHGQRRTSENGDDTHRS